MAECHWIRVVGRLHIALKHHVGQLKCPNVGDPDWTSGLEHATIRDNIIFGSRFGPSNDGFDEVRYDAVLETCALKRDLAIFEAGDLTGERLECVKRGFYRLQAWPRNRRERYHSFWRAKGEDRVGEGIVFTCISKLNSSLPLVGVQLRFFSSFFWMTHSQLSTCIPLSIL